MHSFTYCVPTQIVFGGESVEKLPELLKEMCIRDRPELVRAPGDGVQAELCAAAAPLQNGKFAHGGLAVRRNFAQEAAARAARDGKVDDALSLIHI